MWGKQEISCKGPLLLSVWLPANSPRDSRQRSFWSPLHCASPCGMNASSMKERKRVRIDQKQARQEAEWDCLHRTQDIVQLLSGNRPETARGYTAGPRPGRSISRITRCTIYAYVYSNSKNNQKQNRGTMKYMMRRLPDDAEPGINWYLHNRCKCRVSIELLAIRRQKENKRSD